MRYHLTCLTPLLVGDGSRLTPVDYMVWRDQVNVLDQMRIFRLLAKGPRLENYLKQIKLADKLDFASWGGFAQNFAERRIPFEHPAYTAYWEALSREYLHIPTFVTNHSGAYLPGSAVRGALRTALVFERAGEAAIKALATPLDQERPPIRPGEVLEERTLGASRQSRMKGFSVADSNPVAPSAMKIFLLRVATLDRKPDGKYSLRWKQSPRGSVDGSRPEESTPVFAEMAPPGTKFEGHWKEHRFYQHPAVVRALHWKEPVSAPILMKAANAYAGAQLSVHRQYAQWTGLSALEASLNQLESRLEELRQRNNACLLCIGWGGGFLSKSGYPRTDEGWYRQLLRQSGAYAKAAASDLPFPKTRKIVFVQNKPAALPGWAELEIV